VVGVREVIDLKNRVVSRFVTKHVPASTVTRYVTRYVTRHVGVITRYVDYVPTVNGKKKIVVFEVTQFVDGRRKISVYDPTRLVKGLWGDMSAM